MVFTVVKKRTGNKEKRKYSVAKRG